MYESSISKRAVTPGTVSRGQRQTYLENEVYSNHESLIIDEEEETREISEHLSIIRKKHDKIKEENLKKRKTLERLKKDHEMALEVSQTQGNELKYLKDLLENIQTQLEDTRNQQRTETKDSNTYLHILDRMKKDKIAMEIKANTIQVSLKTTKQVLNTETKNYRKVRETHFQSRLILRELQKSFISQKKIKDEKVQELERNLKSRQEAASRREYRQKKQAEIAEAAAKDDKDSHEVKLRESLLLNKMWQHYLNKKLEKEISQAVEIEKAFKKIKMATGLNDINDISEKYLTREQNYLTLISAVNESERKLEILKISNEKARETLQKMQLEDVDNKVYYNEIDKYDLKLINSMKEYSGIKEKLQNSTKIYNQIINWCGKIMSLLKITGKNPDNEIDNKEKLSLFDMFNEIYGRLEEIITPILEDKQEILKAVEKYEQKKTSEIIQELDVNEYKVNIIKIDAEDGEDYVEETFKPESKDESHRKSKRNK
jgi:hypothetical protein